MSILDNSTQNNSVQTPDTDQTEPDRPNPASQVKFDDSRVSASYANFCRVTGTSGELIIDFGLILNLLAFRQLQL